MQPLPNTNIPDKTPTAQLGAFLDSNPQLLKDGNLASKNAILGNTVQNSPTSPQNGEFSKYRLLSFSQKIISDKHIQNMSGKNLHRQSNCHNARAFQADAITVMISDDITSGKAYLSGVQTCQNIWGCPCCAPRIATERAKEIKQALKWAYENGYVVLMMTLTARHDKQSGLKPFRKDFNKAYQLFMNNGTMSRIKNKVGIKYTIKAVEAPYGDNGWHYHVHVLLFVKKSSIMKLSDGVLDDIETKLAENWVKQLKRHGLSGIEDYAFNLKRTGDVAQHYLTKLGMSEDTKGANAQYELTSSTTKSIGGEDIFRILKNAKEDFDTFGRHGIYSRLYKIFMEDMAGQAWIHWTPEFKKIVGIGEVSDEEAVANNIEAENAKMIALLDISDIEYEPIRKYKKIAELLELASSSRDADVVRDYLYELQEKLSDERWNMSLEAMQQGQDNTVLFNIANASLDDLHKWRAEARLEIQGLESYLDVMKHRWQDSRERRRKSKAKSKRLLFMKYHKWISQAISDSQKTLF